MGKAVALITGASRGIGRGVALSLAEHGYDIAGAATRIDADDRTSGLMEVGARVEELGVRFAPVAGDIASPADHETMLARTLEAFGQVDILVNNAGVGPIKRLDVLETTEESYDRVMSVNLRGPFFFTQRVARQMVRQVREGTAYAPRIIFITSISAAAASPNRVEYCVSKAGLSMTAQSYAVRLADEGIRVYEVRPGIIASDMTAPVRERYDDLIASGLLLQRRWGSPEDVGKACAAIAEGYLDYSTGGVIHVDGGFSVQRL